jgi:hypothetical protein
VRHSVPWFESSLEKESHKTDFLLFSSSAAFSFDELLHLMMMMIVFGLARLQQ